MNGSFLTSRKIFNHTLWKNIIDFRLFFLIYGNAVFTNYKHGELDLTRGQWVRSLRNIQKDLEYIENKQPQKYSLSTLKRAIERLENEDMITTETTKQGTLFTVKNYDYYQTFESRNPELDPERENVGTPNTPNAVKSVDNKGFLEVVKDNPERKNEGTPNSTPNKNNYVLNNYKNIDDDKERKTLNFFDSFYMCYGKQLTPMQIQKINSILDDGLEESCLIYGIELASSSSSHFQYLYTILNNWIRQGIKTREQAEQENNKKSKGVKKHEHESNKPNESKYKRYDFGF